MFWKKNSESLKIQSILDEYNTFIELFPIETAATLKEVKSIIENNSAFKRKLVHYIFKYYFIY